MCAQGKKSLVPTRKWAPSVFRGLKLILAGAANEMQGLLRHEKTNLMTKVCAMISMDLAISVIIDHLLNWPEHDPVSCLITCFAVQVVYSSDC